MKKHYVNNKDFYEAIIAYKAVLVENPSARIPNYIGECIMKICERLSTNRNFIGYSFRDEMVADGIENCIYAVPLFNPEKTSNPFGYFTQIAWSRRISRRRFRDRGSPGGSGNAKQEKATCCRQAYCPLYQGGKGVCEEREAHSVYCCR